MNEHLKALCVAVLTERVGGAHFNQLLLDTGIKLDSLEWDVANKILGKADEMKDSLGTSTLTLH